MKKVLNYGLKFFSFILIFLVFLTVSLYITILEITHGPSKTARNLFTTTMLETGALKWIPSLVLDSKTIQDIVNSNSLVEMTEEVNSDLILVPSESPKVEEPIEIVPVPGSNYYGTMMIVHDPSRVMVGSTYPFSEYGQTLEQVVKKFGAVAGVNGGLYAQDEGKGGSPMGVLVQQGQIVWNAPNYRPGYVLVGLDNNNILKIINIDGYNSAGIYNLVQREGIRDAVTFQEEATDANNHFVKLIVNGEARLTYGNGSGANPRTAIGQREDGSILLFVTDGRGANGHLGATALDLIEVMKKFGAVNAANIDGGSSSCMYFNGKYIMTSTTFYYSNSSWKLPDAFIVK